MFLLKHPTESLQHSDLATQNLHKNLECGEQEKAKSEMLNKEILHESWNTLQAAATNHSCYVFGYHPKPSVNQVYNELIDSISHKTIISVQHLTLIFKHY